MRWVSFKDVKQRVSIREVLAHYAVDNLRAHGRKLIGPCPVHGGDSATAFHVDLDKNCWHCFTGCKGGGSVLDLAAGIEGISMREAALKLQALFLDDGAAGSAPAPTPKQSAGVPPTPHAGPRPPPRSTGTNAPLPFTLNLAGDHPYLTETRKLTPSTIAHFGLGYCPKGILRGRIAIPIHDTDGELIAYAGRRIDDRQDARRPRYRFPKGFHKQLVLYNLHRAQEAANRTGRLVVVEGFFDVFRLHQAGVEEVVALMGSAMSLEQEALLRSSARHVALFFDGDDAGRQAAEDCLWRLVFDMPVRVVDPPDGLQPDGLSSDELHRLLILGG